LELKKSLKLITTEKIQKRNELKLKINKIKETEKNNQEPKTAEAGTQLTSAEISERLDKATQAINELKEVGEKEAQELAILQAEEEQASKKDEGEPEELQPLSLEEQTQTRVNDYIDKFTEKKNKELDIKTEARELDFLANQEIEIKAKYFNTKEKLEELQNNNGSQEEIDLLNKELEIYATQREEISKKLGEQTDKLNQLTEIKEEVSTEKEKDEEKIEENNPDLPEKSKREILSDLLDEEDQIKQSYFDLQNKVENGTANEEERELYEQQKNRRSEIEQEKDELNKFFLGEEYFAKQNIENAQEILKENEDNKNTQTINELYGKKGQIINDLYKNPDTQNPIQEKTINDIYAEKLKNQENPDANQAIEEIAQNQDKKKEGWFSKQTESVKNAFDKSMDWFTNTGAVKWWNKDYSERTTGEKVTKSLMSAGFIGTALYFTGEKLDLLPKDTGFLGKVGSRTFMAGLATSFLASGTAKKGMEWTKDKLANMNKAQKIATLGALGVAGVGGFVYFAGIGALATAGVALGTRVSLDKYHFNKKIDSKKTGISVKEQEIAKIKEDIEKIQKEKNIEETKKELDINALMNNWGNIEKDIQKLNGELRKIKTYQSLTRGAVSLAGGLGTMAVVNAASSGGAWEKIKNWWNKDNNTESETITNDNNIKDLDASVKKSGEAIKELEEANKKLVNIPESDKFNIPKEAIIDGKDRVGITYALRDQLRADEKLAKALNIDSAKLNDAKYVATEMKKLAIKLGYMDERGHEIRVAEANKVAYVLSINEDGKAEVSEVEVGTGKVIETHCEGDNFEGKNYNKEYEYYEDKKYDYSPKINKINAPIDQTPPPYPGAVTDNTINDNIDPIEKPPLPTDAKNTSNIETYDYENIKKSPEWQKVENMKLKEFFAIGKSNMSPEQIKIAEYLRSQYAEALAKDGDLKNFILSKQESITVQGAHEVYNDVINKNYDIKPVDIEVIADKKYNSEALEQELKNNQELQEMQQVAKDAGYDISPEELKNAQKAYQENLNTIFGKDKTLWNEGKYQSASKYMKLKDPDPLSKHLNELKKLGRNYEPKDGFLGMKKEQIDHYLMRVTLQAEKSGQLDIIKPKINASDELYQNTKTDKTETIINKKNNPKDDLYN
jgi:hypothetical protein